MHCKGGGGEKEPKGGVGCLSVRRRGKKECPSQGEKKGGVLVFNNYYIFHLLGGKGCSMGREGGKKEAVDSA